MVFEDFEDSSLEIDFTQINGGFERTTDAAFEGSHSFVSTNTTDDSTSAIEFDINNSGTLNLYYKISSEDGFDFGRILLNGSQVLEVSGDKNFELFSLQVVPNDTVRIEYDKDGSISQNSDAFFIDNINTPSSNNIGGISQFNKKKKLNVSSVSGTPTVDKAQPLIISGEVGNFDLSTVSFTDSFDISPQHAAPTEVAFSNSGEKMFVIGDSSNQISQYSLSSPFDVSTASFTDSFDVSNQDDFPSGVAFSENGRKMFVTGDSGENVYEYSLSPFDVSTAVFNDSFDVSDQMFGPEDVTFNDAGDKMFVLDGSSDDVFEYSLSTNFDVTTASFTDTFDATDQTSGPRGIAFNDTGDKMFLVGSSSDNVYEYSLSTSFDVSTASFTDSIDISGQETGPKGITFDDRGAKMFIVGDIGDNVYEYSLVTKSESKTGNGDIVIDFSDINDAQDLAVYDQNGDLLDYEIEDLDTTNETAILWVYNSWVRDGSTQAQLAYGDNSANTDRQDVTGTWNNTGQNAGAIYHLEDTSDSAGNTSNLSVNGPTAVSGKLGGGYDFDGNDDTLENPDSQFVDPGPPMTLVSVVNNDVTPDSGIENMGVVGTQNVFFDSENGFDLSQFSNSDQYGFGVEYGGTRTGVRDTLVDSEWVDENVQFAGSVTSNRIRVYKDGGLANEATASIGDFRGSDNFRIGGLDQGGNGDSFNGQVYEVRVYSEEKRQEWLKADSDALPSGGQVFFDQESPQPAERPPVNKALTESLTVSSEEQGTNVSHGRFQSPSSTGTITESIGFQPDAVQFRVTSTNNTFNNESTGFTGDFGWGHGVAKFNDDGTVEEFALSHGSGSDSTNGHLSESTSSFSVFQVVTDNSGDVDEGRVAGSASRTSDGFELSFNSTQEQQQVFYTAYKFTGGSVDVGFFNAPNSTGTKSITEPGFKPNFLRLFATPSLNTMDSINNELRSGTDVGWGQGVAVENSGGVKQGSLAVSQFSRNIDGHAYTSSDTDVFSMAFMNNKQTLDGTAKGSVTFTSNGFDINFGTVNAPNNETPLTVYLAADSASEPDAGFEKTPTGTGSVSYTTDTDLDNLCVFSSNTVPVFNQESGVGSQTWGWNYGQLNSATDTQQIGFYSNSNSVNAHAFSADNILYKSIYTNRTGAEQGRVEGDISSIGTSSFSINYSTVSTDSSFGNIEGDTEAFAYYGFSSGGISDGLGASAKKVGETLTESFIETFSVFDTQNNATKFLTSLSESISAFADVVSLGEVVGSVPQDGVFNTGRFDQATFNTLRRGETQGSSAQVSSFKVDVVPLSVNLFVSDADVLNAGINLFENQFVADAESKAAEKPLNEVSNVSDELLKTLATLKSASFAASDQEASGLSKPFVESVSSADALSKLALKELSEVPTLSDIESFRASKPLSETSLLSDVVSQVSSLQRLFELSVVSDDSATKEPGLTLGESVDALDSVRQVGESFRLFTEQVVGFSDADKQVSKPLSEGVSSADLIGREAVKSLTQRVSVSDSDISNISQPLTESFAAASTATSEQSAQRTLLESAALNDVEQMKVFRGITQQVGSLADLSFFFGTSVAESASPQDDESRLFSGSRDLQASVDVTDFLTDDLAVVVLLAESANLQDVERSESDLSRAFAEEHGVTGSVRKQLARSISESAAASDIESVLYATSLAESQGLSDATSAVISSVLRQDAGVGDEVQPTAELLRVFSQAVSSSDEERFNASQPLTESSSPVASFSRVSQRFRALAQDVVSADNSSLKLARVLFEEFISDDVSRVEASLFRLFAESLQVQSSVSEFRAFRVFEEGVEPADVFAKRLDTALSEAASASDEVVREAGLRRRRRAELFVSDSDIFDFQKPLFESAAAQDSFSSEASLFRDFEQGAGVADVERVETRRELGESSGLVDEVQRAAELLRFLDEDAELVDTERVLAGRRFGEDVGVVDAESLKASLELEQGVSAEDFESFLFETAILESFSQFSEAGSEAELLRSVFEAFSASDEESELVSKLLGELQPVEDSESVSVFRLLGESARVQLGFSRDAVFKRSVLQGLSVIDIENVFSQRVFTEGLAAVDSLAFALRRALDAGFSVSDVLSLLVPAEKVPDAVDLAALRVAVAELSKTRAAFADLEAKA